MNKRGTTSTTYIGRVLAGLAASVPEGGPVQQERRPAQGRGDPALLRVPHGQVHPGPPPLVNRVAAP